MVSRDARRRLAFCATGIVVGAAILLTIGVIEGASGVRDLTRVGLMGAAAGLLIALGLVGAIEDGRFQRANDRARRGRRGTANR